MAEQSDQSRLWPKSHSALVLALVFLLAILAYWPTVENLVDRWVNSEDAYSHGIIVFPLVLWCFLELSSEGGKPLPQLLLAAVGLIAIVISFIWFIATAIGINAIAQLSFVAIVGSVYLLLYASANQYRSVLVSMLLALCTLPIYGELNEHLRSLATFVVQNAIRFADVPVVVNEFEIEISQGTFLVAGGCSGLAYLLSSWCVALYWCHLDRASARGILFRILLLSMSALVANWLRIIIIILSGHHFGMQTYLIAVDHYWFGWVLYSAVLLGSLLAARGYSVRSSEMTSLPSRKSSRQAFVYVAVAFLLVAPAAERLLRLASSQASAETSSALLDQWRSESFIVTPKKWGAIGYRGSKVKVFVRFPYQAAGFDIDVLKDEQTFYQRLGIENELASMDKMSSELFISDQSVGFDRLKEQQIRSVLTQFRSDAHWIAEYSLP